MYVDKGFSVLLFVANNDVRGWQGGWWCKAGVKVCQVLCCRLRFLAPNQPCVVLLYFVVVVVVAVAFVPKYAGASAAFVVH